MTKKKELLSIEDINQINSIQKQIEALQEKQNNICKEAISKVQNDEMEIFNKNMDYMGLPHWTYEEMQEIELARIQAKIASGTRLTPREQSEEVQNTYLDEPTKRKRGNKEIKMINKIEDNNFINN